VEEPHGHRQRRAVGLHGGENHGLLAGQEPLDARVVERHRRPFRAGRATGMIGSSTCEGCLGPQWMVTDLPKTSGGLSAASSCLNGPTPVKTAPSVPSPTAGPPGNS